MRVITQNLSQVAADPDGISVNATDAVGPFPVNLTLGGALTSTLPWNGNSVFELASAPAVLIGFTTGITGSVANATVTGRNIFGDPITETVVLPGASSTVSTTEAFSYVESISVDGAYTNLSVGILSTDAQYGPWTPHDVNQSGFNVTVDVELVSGTVNYTMQHTVQGDLLINGPEPDSGFNDTTMAGETATSQANITQPVTASRIVINSGTAAVLRAKFLQTGGGDR